VHVVEDSGGFSKTLDSGRAGSPSVTLDEPMKEKIRRYSHQFAPEIGTLYSVTVPLSESSDKPQHIEMSVVDGRGQKRKGLFVAYPHKLSACTVESAKH